MKNTLKLLTLALVLSSLSMGLNAGVNELTTLAPNYANRFSSCSYDDQARVVTCHVSTPAIEPIVVHPQSFHAYSMCQGNPDTNNPNFIGTYPNPFHQGPGLMGGQNKTCSVILISTTPLPITQ